MEFTGLLLDINKPKEMQRAVICSLLASDSLYKKNGRFPSAV